MLTSRSVEEEDAFDRSSRFVEKAALHPLSFFKDANEASLLIPNDQSSADIATKNQRKFFKTLVFYAFFAAVVSLLLFLRVCVDDRSSAFLFSRDDRYNTFLLDLIKLDQEIDGNVVFDVTNKRVAASTRKSHSDAPFTFAEVAAVWRMDAPLPAAVVMALNEGDVQKAVPVLAKLKKMHGIPFRIKSGGHNKAGYSSVKDGIVLSLAKMNQIYLQPSNTSTAVAVIQPGARVEDILDDVLEHENYAGVLGQCGRVAEGGFVMGGGLGSMSRLLGLGVDQVKSMRVVLVDGSVEIVSGDHELFWALRGAGSGNYGVVTEMEYTVYKIQPVQYASVAQLPLDGFWEFLTKVGSDLNPPGEFSVECAGMDGTGFGGTGSPTVECFFSWFGLDHDPILLRERALQYFSEELARVLPPTSVLPNLTAMPWAEGTHLISDTGYGRAVWAAQYWGGFLFPENNTFAVWTKIGALLEAGMKESPDLAPDIELWGGAISDVPVERTAFSYRKAVYNVGVILIIESDRTGTPAKEAFQQQVEQVNDWWPKVAEYLTGVYVNYPMPSLTREQYPKAYFGEHLEKLVSIKQRYDPDNIFSYEQSMPVSLP